MKSSLAKEFFLCILISLLFGCARPPTFPPPPTATPTETPPNFPFKPTIYDFENQAGETDITPWFTVPDIKHYEAKISQDSAHSGKYSLRLFVDMQDAATNRDTEYAGIGMIGEVPLQAKAVVFWVYIPSSEPIQNTNFKAHVLAYVNNETVAGIYFNGEDTQVKPGIWTPVFIGTFGEVDLPSGPFVWNGKIDELYLTIWSDKAYNGSMYIDDISIYNDRVAQ